MQDTITLLQQELETTNREVMLLTLELEQRVADRTAELSRANQSLMKEIAERLRAEAEIKQLNRDLEHRAELLEAANQELEAFSYSVSHDLRAPLRHIVGFASALDEDAGETLAADARVHLERITKAAYKMSVLIEELLRFSRNSRTELNWTSVDLNEVVDTCIRDLEPDTRARKITWKCGRLPVVKGDLALLRQVFANLLSNALKYTQTRDIAEIEYGVHQQGQETSTIFIRDNGVGFDPLHAGKLFGVFQRLHSDREFEGTGIGLANVRRIVARHRGTVWAEGKVDGGATFYLTLPMRVPD